MVPPNGETPRIKKSKWRGGGYQPRLHRLHSKRKLDKKNILKRTEYLANSASCLGSLRSSPGMPPGGSFLPVMYSVKSASVSDTDASSSNLILSSVPTKSISLLLL